MTSIYLYGTRNYDFALENALFFSSVISDAETLDSSKKDRSKARIRRNNYLKEKKRAIASAKYLDSRYDRLSINANYEEVYRLAVRSIRANKIAARYSR